MRNKGKHYEEEAEKFLTTKGYLLIKKNYFFGSTEIDLIMISPEDILIFVEVKFRKFLQTNTNSMFIHPFFAVGIKKQQNLIKAASGFLSQYPKYQDYFCRYDVIAFVLTENENNQLEIEHLENAFQITETNN